MPSSIEDAIHQLHQRWAGAEQRGDTDTLATLTTDEFVLVGPLGFLLNKQQWLLAGIQLSPIAAPPASAQNPPTPENQETRSQ